MDPPNSGPNALLIITDATSQDNNNNNKNEKIFYTQILNTIPLCMYALIIYTLGLSNYHDSAQ